MYQQHRAEREHLNNMERAISFLCDLNNTNKRNSEEIDFQSFLEIFDEFLTFSFYSNDFDFM